MPQSNRDSASAETGAQVSARPQPSSTGPSDGGKVRAFDWAGEGKDLMPKKQQGQIIEAASEARQAEPGPSVLALLAISNSLAVLILAGLWFAFFRT